MMSGILSYVEEVINGTKVASGSKIFSLLRTINSYDRDRIYDFDANGDNALHKIVKALNFPLLNYIIAFPNLDLNRQNSLGNTALHEALINHHNSFNGISIINRLLDKKRNHSSNFFNLYILNHDNNSLFDLAIKNNDPNALLSLKDYLIHSFRYNNQDQQNLIIITLYNSLTKAVEHGSPDCLNHMLETCKVIRELRINFTNYDNKERNILYLAAKRGDLVIQEILLEQNLPYFKKINHDGNSILHYCILHEQKDFLNLLLQKKKAHLNIQNPDSKETALHLAIRTGKTQFVEILCKHKADYRTITNSDKKTAFETALDSNNPDIISIFFNMRKSINEAVNPSTKKHMLFYALENTISSESFREILSYDNIAINQYENGKHILVRAIEIGKSEIAVLFLLSKNLELKQADFNQALNLAEKFELSTLSKELLKYAQANNEALTINTSFINASKPQRPHKNSTSSHITEQSKTDNPAILAEGNKPHIQKNSGLSSFCQMFFWNKVHIETDRYI